MNKGDRLVSLSYSLQRKRFVRIISGGLIMIIPVLMIGAFSLIITTFPVPAYIAFIKAFFDGAIFSVFDMIYKATFGVLSVYMTLSLSYNYQKESGQGYVRVVGGMLAALVCFFILSGVFSADFKIDAIGPKGMVSALLCGYSITAVYCRLSERLHLVRLYTDGADERFNRAVVMIIPIAALVFAIALITQVMSLIFNVSTLQQLISKGVNALFSLSSGNFGSGLLFVLLSSVLWFFGIHGSDCLEMASATLFQPAIDVNIAAAASGAAPTEILTKQFFDMFVLMGGCGSAICLLISLAIFGRRRSDKRLARLAALPMLFNINEVMIFGLPVILNPIMLVPFIITPLVSYVVSYLAVSSGLVGMTVAAVEWTTPVILGGYISTGQISGSLLQLFNILLGTAIYAPFIRIMDKLKEKSAKSNYDALVDFFKSFEETGSGIELTALDNELGMTAKMLATDLQTWMDEAKPLLFFQPQYNYEGKCIGVESLLRWKHREYGLIYPPLVMKLAGECGYLNKLEKEIFRTALSQYPEIKKRLGDSVKLSVNVTGTTLAESGYVDFLRTFADSSKGVCIEITEQAALQMNDYTALVLTEIKELGFSLAIDDFSMGQTSISYLKGKQFDLVKLDGSLVREISTNPRCLNIIQSIIGLSRSLGFSVLAEYVETEEMREMLHASGCNLYQGYLYSPAVPIDKL